MKKVMASNKLLFGLVLAILVVAMVVPLVIEYWFSLPGGKHGDWLNFWGQYLGTWIALLGSSTIAILVATIEIKSSRATDMRMFQIKERSQYAFQLIDVVQEVIFQFEYPIFRKKEAEDITQSQWIEHVKQVKELQEFFYQLGPKINLFRYKLPSGFIEDFWKVFAAGSKIQKLQASIQNKSMIMNKSMLTYANTQQGSERDRLKVSIDNQLIGINDDIRELRNGFSELAQKCQKYIDLLEHSLD